MKEAFLIVWDVEWFYQKFRTLEEVSQDICESVRLIVFVGDVVWKWPGNIALLRWCFENQERVKMILGNKDYLVQQIIGWKKTNIQWAHSLARELDKKENICLRDFFLAAYIRYFVSEKFIVSHARLVEGKPIHKHTPKQLSGVNTSSRGKRFYEDPHERVLLHWHHSREGYIVQRRKDGSIQRIGLDTGAGKGERIPLTWALIWKKQETIRIIDSSWKEEKLKF